jgi:cyclic pyranopterin phosphate synthase
MGLTDSHGRRINYLRLSVTDRCNLRCRYCMPAEGVAKLSHHDILSFEDLQRIAVQSIALGIEKIRVTGGEPLVRRGVVSFLAKLAAIRGLKEMVLTTNGLLLREMAAELRRAGVQRLNVSLDSLNPETFATITRGGDLKQALDGIDAAEEAGFPPVKINMVVMRGINDGEVLDPAQALHRTLHRVHADQNGAWMEVALRHRERDPETSRKPLSYPATGTRPYGRPRKELQDCRRGRYDWRDYADFE